MLSVPPVLCYHRIGGPLELGVTRVGRRVFARQMRALARAGWHALTQDEFTERLRARPAAPQQQRGARREFLLTFDDGYDSLADTAYPLLRDLGFTATTFIITDYVGRPNTWDAHYAWRRLRHLDWATIETWQARGFTFASHGATHRRLTWLRDEAAGEDLARARAVLMRRLGAAAGRALAYPFGAVDHRVARIAREVGYTMGFGGVRGNGDPLELPRVPVYLWDATNLPAGLRDGVLGAAGRLVAHLANRCAVGTSVMQVIGRRFPVISTDDR